MSFLFLFGGICERSPKGRLAHPALNQPKLSSCEPPDLGHAWNQNPSWEFVSKHYSAALCGGHSIVNCEYRSLGPIVQGFQEPKFIQFFFWYCISTFPVLAQTISQLRNFAQLGKSSVKTVPHTDHRPVKLARVLGPRSGAYTVDSPPKIKQNLNLKMFFFQDVFRIFRGRGPVFSGTKCINFQGVGAPNECSPRLLQHLKQDFKVWKSLECWGVD